jgi:hypothetical protein
MKTPLEVHPFGLSRDAAIVPPAGPGVAEARKNISSWRIPSLVADLNSSAGPTKSLRVEGQGPAATIRDEGRSTMSSTNRRNRRMQLELEGLEDRKLLSTFTDGHAAFVDGHCRGGVCFSSTTPGVTVSAARPLIASPVG